LTQKRRLPPLKSLQTFEVAARNLSFANAAEELCVTPAAVSQQIKQLENYLGITLFHRMKQSVYLTDEAAAVLPMISESFDKLEDAVIRLAREQWAGRLTVSSVPTFSIKWLVHNLADFSRQYPDIDVRLDASMEFRDFQSDGIDVSIRFGLGNYPGLHVTRIFGEEFILVCSPSLLVGENSLKNPKDIAHHRLLHVDWGGLNSESKEWDAWTKAAGVAGIDLTRGPRFTFENMAIEAAVNGDGVALVSYYAVIEELNSGRLVKPFDIKVESELAYWLVCPHAHLHRKKVKSFCDWLSNGAAGYGSTTPPVNPSE
jgi:LysR family glycine cleavage system transcriptional activator